MTMPNEGEETEAQHQAGPEAEDKQPTGAGLAALQPPEGGGEGAEAGAGEGEPSGAEGEVAEGQVEAPEQAETQRRQRELEAHLQSVASALARGKQLPPVPDGMQVPDAIRALYEPKPKRAEPRSPEVEALRDEVARLKAVVAAAPEAIARAILEEPEEASKKARQIAADLSYAQRAVTPESQIRAMLSHLREKGYEVREGDWEQTVADLRAAGVDTADDERDPQTALNRAIVSAMRLPSKVDATERARQQEREKAQEDVAQARREFRDELVRQGGALSGARMAAAGGVAQPDLKTVKGIMKAVESGQISEDEGRRRLQTMSQNAAG